MLGGAAQWPLISRAGKSGSGCWGERGRGDWGGLGVRRHGRTSAGDPKGTQHGSPQPYFTTSPGQGLSRMEVVAREAKPGVFLATQRAPLLRRAREVLETLMSCCSRTRGTGGAGSSPQGARHSVNDGRLQLAQSTAHPELNSGERCPCPAEHGAGLPPGTADPSLCWREPCSASAKKRKIWPGAAGGGCCQEDFTPSRCLPFTLHPAARRAGRQTAPRSSYLAACHRSWSELRGGAAATLE